MTCDLKPTCDFIFRLLRCSLPKDTISVGLRVRTVKAIHTFRKDYTSDQATCSPWRRQMKPSTSLRKKMGAFEEEKRVENSPFNPNLIKFTMRSGERSHKRGKQRRYIDMSHFTPPKAKRPVFFGPHCQLQILPPPLPWLLTPV